MRGVLFGLGAAALFGASTPACKWLLAETPPLALAALLYLGAALGTAPFGARRREAGGASIDRVNALRLAGAIVAGGVAGPVLLLVGLRSSSAGSVSLLLNLELVATAVLGASLFRDALGPRGWLGVAGAVAAGFVVSWSSGWPGVTAALWVAAACLCWGLDNHLTARIDGLSPARSAFAKGLFAGATNLGLAFAHGDIAVVAPAHAAIGLCVGALSYGASIALYIASAQEVGATRAQALFAAAPFAGAAIAWTALGEPVEPAQAVGAVLLAASTALVLSARHEHAHVHGALEHVHAHRHDDGHHDHAHPGLAPGMRHSHWHRHEPRSHAHPHWPDLHHRHEHEHAGD
jgi:drug/metabolite transporter (DMT)-like permease